MKGELAYCSSSLLRNHAVKNERGGQKEGVVKNHDLQNLLPPQDGWLFRQRVQPWSKIS